jgi:hypothetical protein
MIYGAGISEALAVEKKILVITGAAISAFRVMDGLHTNISL